MAPVPLSVDASGVIANLDEAECDPQDVECFQTTECINVTKEVCFLANEVTNEENCVDEATPKCVDQLVKDCSKGKCRTVPKKVCEDVPQRSCTSVPRFQQVEKCEPRVQQSCSIVPVCRPRTPGCPLKLDAIPSFGPIQLHAAVSHQLGLQQNQAAAVQQPIQPQPTSVPQRLQVPGKC